MFYFFCKEKYVVNRSYKNLKKLNYQLWDDQAGPEEDQAETANCEKLRFDANILHFKENFEVNLNVFRNFLGFGLSKEDRLPKQVLIKPLIALYDIYVMVHLHNWLLCIITGFYT